MKKSWILAIVCVVVAVVLPQVITNAYFIQILFSTALYAFLASSWNIVGGFAGQLGIGNGLYFGLGVYLTIALFCTADISPWIGLIIAGLITGAISLLLGFATFSLRTAYYGLATVALLNILRIVFNENAKMFGLDFGGSAGLRVKWKGDFASMQFTSKLPYFYIVLAMLIGVLLLTNYISKSKFGFYLMAINTNALAASSLGVKVMTYKIYAQFLTAFLMALGGGVYGIFIMYVDPQTIFSFQISFNIMLMAVFGGRGTVFGPLIGAIVLMPMYEIFRLNFSMTMPGLPMALFGLMLMLCMQFMPNGIVDVGKKLIKKYRHAAQTKAGAVVEGGDANG